MLRLVLGKLYDAAAVLPGKLDARIRQIAAVVNGGLTDDSLDPAFKFANTAFLEQGHLVGLVTRVPNFLRQGSVNEAMSSALPTACVLAGVDTWVTRGDVATKINRRPAAGGAYVELHSEVPSEQPTTRKIPAADGTALWHLQWKPGAPPAFAAGDRATLSVQGVNTAGALAIFWFRIPHEV